MRYLPRASEIARKNYRSFRSYIKTRFDIKFAQVLYYLMRDVKYPYMQIYTFVLKCTLKLPEGYAREEDIPLTKGKRRFTFPRSFAAANRARFARDSEKRHTENKWNCIHGASEGLLRKMNHKWSGRLARTCNRSKGPPDSSIASPDRLTMEFLFGRCVLPLSSYRLARCRVCRLCS